MWNRDLNLFLSPLQHEPWEKTDRTLERRPSPLTFLFFFLSHRKLPRTSLSEIFQFFHSWTSNLQYFLFLSNFSLLDNTLNGGDQVRGGFSSQNIPTPLKTIQKALLLFCLSLTTVVTKSVKKLNILASLTDSFNSPSGNVLFVCTYFQHRWQQLASHLLHIRGLLNYYDIKTCLEVQGSCEGFILHFIMIFIFKKVKAFFTNTVIKPDHL